MPHLVPALQAWTAKELKSSSLHFSPVPGDAGGRRYFRVHGWDRSVIAVIEPDASAADRFINIAALLGSLDVSVPDILSVDADKRFLLISDFGDLLYFRTLREDYATKWYHDAIDTLLKIQSCPPEKYTHLNSYSYELLHDEMQRFPEWMLKRFLSIEVTSDIEKLLSESFERISQHALAQPQVLVHMDYITRNLFHIPHGSPGVIDFQDAIRGPILYDLISLLHDNLPWSDEQIQAWAIYYQTKAQAMGLFPEMTKEEFLYEFYLMSLQRQIRLLGQFVRLEVRDNKQGYFKYLPYVMRYALMITQRYQEFKDLHTFLREVVQPALAETRVCAL